MKQWMRAKMEHAGLYAAALGKWIALGGLIGIFGGLVGSLFHIGVERATVIRDTHSWILYLLPLGGLFIVWLYRATKMEGKGTNDIIESVHFGSEVPLLLVPVIFAATIVTHLFGGSAGREGAALQIGGGIGYHVGGFFHLDDKDLRIATLCGMSGVFSALFGTPLTATVFALEVISVGVLYYVGLIPCMTSAMVAYSVSLLMGVPPTQFLVPMPALEPWSLLLVVILGALCGFVSILFCQSLRQTERLVKKAVKNPYAQVTVGAAALILLTLLMGNTDYNGVGLPMILSALDGTAPTWGWLWKLIFTALTIGCGFKGGEVVPSFFIGAAFGCVAGAFLGLPAGFSAAIGLIAVFCGAVNCPIASIFLSIELFGADGLLYFAAACCISYVVSGYSGLYSSQTILYSKLKAKFINVRTK